MSAQVSGSNPSTMQHADFRFKNHVTCGWWGLPRIFFKKIAIFLLDF
jgi:hypothetical protein